MASKFSTSGLSGGISAGNTSSNTGANKSAGSGKFGNSTSGGMTQSNSSNKFAQGFKSESKNTGNRVTQGIDIASGVTNNKPVNAGSKTIYTSNTPALRMGQFDSQLSDYLNSDNYNVMGLKDYRLTANRYAASAKTEDERQYWVNLANDIDGYAYYTLNDQMEQLSRMLDRYDQGIQNINNEMKSTASVYTGDYETAVRKNETIQGRMNDLVKAKESAKAERDALEDELMGYFMTRDVWEARERLKANDYAKGRLTVGGILNGIVDRGQNQHDKDQALVDDFMHNLGLQAQYYNTPDRLLAKTKAFGERTLAAGAEAFASGGRMASEMKGDGPDTSFAIDRRDLPTYKEPTKMPQIASIEEGQQRIALAQAEIDKLNQQNADLERSTSDDIGYQLAANNKRLKELNKIIKEYGGQVQALEDQQKIEAGEKPSWSYYLKSGSEDYTLSKIEEFADKHAVKGQLLSAKATADTSPAGKFALDLYESVLGIAFDSATAALTGGSSLASKSLLSMFARVYGEEVGNARRTMAENGGIGDRDVLGIKITDRDRQRLYAGAKASIEVITEKMTDGLNLVYGKGITSDIVEDAIQRVAKTDLGADFLRLLAGTGGEGVEELVSGLMDPIAQWLIDEDARGHYASLLDPKELAYEAVMGLALGLVGSSAEFAQQRVLTEAGSEASKNIQYTNELNKKYDKIMERLGEDATSSITDKEQKMIDHLTERVEARNAKNKATFGSKAGLSVDEKGRIQIGKGKSSGANRFEKLREGELERAEALGIGEKVEYNEEGYPESDNEARAKDREIAATGGITEEEAEEDRILSGADDANAPRRATGIQEASEDIPEDTGPAPKKEKSYEDSKKERETQIDEIMGKLDSKGELEVDSRENSRDPEFQRFNKGENKGKRVITRNTLEKMKSATREQPIFFYSDAFDTRDGQMPPRAAMYDGNTLYMVRKGNDGKMYLATVDNNALRQATYIEGMITPYTAGKPARWYSTMNGYGGIADTYARSILEQHGVDLSMVDTSESAIEGAEAQGASEGISVPPQGAETVKPGTTPTQEGVQTNGQETTATAGSTASPTAGEGTVDNPQTSDMGRSQESQRTVRVFERGAKGPNYEATPRYATRAPKFTGLNSIQLTDAWIEAAEAIEDDWGGSVLDGAQTAKLVTEAQLKLKDYVEEHFGIPVTLYKGGAETPLGFTNKAFPGLGLFIDIDSPHFAVTVLHELTHHMWGKFGGNISRRQTVLNALIDAKVDKTDVAKMVNSVLETWGAGYVAPRYGMDQQSWWALTDNERLNRLKMLPNYDDVVELMYEELGNLLVTFDERLSEFDSLFKACTVYQKALVANNVYTETEMREALEAVNKFHSDEYDRKYGLSQQVGEAESFEGTDFRLKDGRTSTQAVRDKISDKSQFFLRDEKAANPHTPGKTKPMTSAQSGLETRGERQTRKENAAPGAETFTSRTNEARSETARLLTDTQEKANAQYRRLMEDGYTFNDDDVVLAQKLLADMQNAIRDFQLKSGNKMSRAGFDQLTKQYNKLFDKHMAEKSRMGQGLQAEYVFSTAERIKQRAAIMFLGFSPDGRFAGKAPGYKNAKMYGIVSDLANRIETAENAGDSKALITLCRDISTIRGTQKMAGVLSGQAAKVETSLLNKIAKHENGAQALAQLAYANANRISDDLSDLKAGEVVKSIRVMNMLSNVATIINNLGNNMVSGGIGIFSQNAVGQLAQKPFERMTGQKVLSKAASGGIANKAIRNAQVEALQYAALMQYYGAVEENGRLELNNRASFNPNANAFEQTMSMYRFLIGMGVEATDKMKAAGLTKAMQMGIDADFAAGKIDATTKAKMESEAAHEVNKLLYKDDNKTTALVQHVKDWLNSLLTVGNEQTGTVGLGDITMAFAKIPANVVKARLAMTPEGALYYTAKYINGLAKAKTMHEQTVARSISEAVDENGNAISDDAKWARARQECSPRVWNQLNKLRTASGGTMNFDSACAKLGYSTAEEMTHFEMATVSRNLGKAATSVGMVALGAALRAIGAIRDFDQEPDEDKKKLLRQKGYTGLMFNVSAIGRPNHEWQDGDTVVGADWLETVAMPLAIGASAAEAAIDGGNVADTLAGKSLMKAIAAVGDIPGMQDAMNFYDSFNNSYVNSEKDTLAKIGDTAVTYLANQLPAFVVPNLFSQASAGIDNTVRNTYAADTTFGKAKNILLNKTGPIAGNVFGLREQIPASVDMWGEERTYGENWVMGLVNKVILPGDVRKYHVNKYEKELYRLSNEGYGSVLPKSSVSTSFDVDGQTFKLTSAEQETWRRDRAAIQRVDIERFLDSETYKELNDRQRQAVLKQLAMDAERTAKKAYLDTKDTSAEVTFAKWETDLNLDEQIEYLGAREILKGVWDDDEHAITDYAGMDEFVTRYNGMNDTQKEIINNNCSYLDDLAEAKEHKINSEQWEQAHNIYRYWQDKISESKDDEYKSNLVNEVQMWSQMQREVGLNDRQMDYLEKNMQLRYQGTPKADQYYEYINDAGLSREQATGLITDMSKLDIMDGYSQVQDSQKYMSIATSNKLKTQKEKWAAFWAIIPSNASKSKVANMKNYESMGLSLEDALRKTGWSEVKWKELQPNGKWKYYTVSK